MADGRHFENGFIAISHPWVIRFQWNLACRHKFWFQEQSHDKVSTFCKCKMADGHHIENSFGYMYISTIYYQINEKFGIKKRPCVS